ncbi:MAG: DUF192 domain-containing protein [Flavobacteriales bacterium]|nr:DUF192 domain-containing protein [Flavobacteriales bacterium]MCB9190104.1 DUF192 domain-containing protein [Flavobacteriales bacterium]MCB9205080.1 DUF192 domain-containing protein [Flavobacteriales bacterium]
MKLKVLFPLLVAVAMAGCDGGSDSSPSNEDSGRSTVRQAGPQFKKEGELWLIKAAGDTIRHIDIEIADVESERTIGLMHRRSMPDTQGMLFIFEREEQRSFWMRNTLIGLDILYIKADGEIESIAKYCVPKSEKSIPSRGPALYVLELIEGFCDIHGVAVGDRIEFVRTDGK